MRTGTAVAALTVFLVILASCGGERTDGWSGATVDPGYADEAPVAVEALEVSSGSLVAEVRGAGFARGTREAWVVAEAEGLVRRVAFDLGDRVSEGDLLLEVDSSLAARDRDLAEQRYRTAELEFEAAERSAANGSMSALQFSRTKDALLAAEAGWAAARDAYDNAFLKAPFDGVVALRDQDLGIGSYLGRGTRVVRIVDDSAFRVEFGVGEGQVLLVDQGAEARIAGKDGTVRLGRVAAVSAGSDEGTGSYVVVVEWIPEPGDKLRSGMSVDVSVDAVNGAPTVLVPATALRIRQGRKYVYVASEGVAAVREVETGARIGERTEVLRGLEDGETLIVSGLASLTPGRPVEATVIGKSGDAG